jgi:hypothetical protein
MPEATDQKEHAMTTIDLDICTPEGKTWLAEITGTDPRFGLAREFVAATSRSTSRSGRTGTATYAVRDGLYESNEGRRRLGKRYWRVEDGNITEIDRNELLIALGEAER